MLEVRVIGPRPFTEGGVGVMSGYLESTDSQRTRLRFDDPGASKGPAWRRGLDFARVAGQCLLGPRDAWVGVLSLATRGSTLRKVLLGRLLALRGRPYVVHLHGGAYDSWVAAQPAALRRAIRRLFSEAEQVAVLGDSWAEFVSRDLGVDPERVSVLVNCVPGPAEVPDRTGPLRILFAGAVGARKGAPELLEAWEQIADHRGAVLVLAGDLRDPDGALSAQLERSRDTELLGWLGQEELTAQMARAQVLVLPSRAENLPLSVLEGMAWGLAPVVTPVGAVPEAVRHEQEGLLVPVGDVASLREALERLVADAPLRAELGAAARRRWEDRYALQRYRARFDDVVEAAAASAARRPARFRRGRRA